MRSGFAQYRIRLQMLEEDDARGSRSSEVISVDTFFKYGRSPQGVPGGHRAKQLEQVEEHEDNPKAYYGPVKADPKAIAALDALPRPKKPPGKRA